MSEQRAPVIHISVEHPRGTWPRRVVLRRSREFMERLGQGGHELSILLTTDAGIRDLNRRFRDIDRATDVLSFPAGPPMPGEAPSLGDLAISVDTARRVAKKDGRSVAEELSRYLAHGILHLLGYDHERSEAEAREMARREEELLGASGMLGG